jgi:FAD/FMN-containing dehydrogenase
VNPEAVQENVMYEVLEEQLRGDLILPEEEGYDEHRRVWNKLFDHHPAAIARCKGAADVIAAVNFARENDILLAVRGGGHSYAGNSSCDGGLLIDLAPMDGIRVDPKTQTARVEAGARWDDLFYECEPFGLGVTSGPPQAGVAGVTLGGGIGYLSRKFGLTLDNLIAADVVTAEGELVHASEDENPELLWGLRGGSGNFGVVTSFELQLHDIGQEQLSGQIIHPFEGAADTLAFYRDFMAEAPDELTVFVLVYTIPPLEMFPEEHHGTSAICLAACYAGPIEEGEEVLRPLREFGNPIFDTIQPQPFRQFKHTDDAAVEMIERFYAKSNYLSEFPDEAIDTFVDFIENLEGVVSLVGLMPTDGAIRRVDPDATAFPHRNTAWECDLYAAWNEADQDDAMIRWAHEFHEAMSPWATGGYYVNMLGHDEEDRVRAAYGDNYDRLKALKKKWDPNNLFRRNHNIAPDE